MSIIYSIICLVNLVFLFTYVALLACWLKKNHRINVKQRKIQFILSLSICLTFLCIFLLEVVIEKSWSASTSLNLICFILWAVCTGFEFSNWKRAKKDLFEKEKFLKDLEGAVFAATKSCEIEHEKNNSDGNE